MPGIEDCDWLILPLLLLTLTMQFSLDRKRRSHKWNRYFASDYDSLLYSSEYDSNSNSVASEDQHKGTVYMKGGCPG